MQIIHSFVGFAYFAQNFTGMMKQRKTSLNRPRQWGKQQKQLPMTTVAIKTLCLNKKN